MPRARAAVGSFVVVAVALMGIVAVRPAPVGAAADFAFTRIAGDDRYDTAASAAVDRGAATNAVLATGENFPDALSAAYVAGALDAPVLLTAADAVPAPTAAALEEIGAENVTIIGGTATITTAVEEDLKTRGYAVERVAGGDRYETAAFVAAKPGATHVGTAGEGELRTAILASGEAFPDATASAPLSFAAKLPLLLTPAAALSEAAAGALGDLEIEQVLIAGGTSAVSADVEAAVVELGIEVIRFHGADRTDTAAKVATFAVESLGFSASDFSLARGDDYPDALAAAPHGGDRAAATLLTTSPDTLSEPTATWLELHADTLQTGTIFGGPAAVSVEVEEEAAAIATGDGGGDDDPGGFTLAETEGPPNASATNDSTPTYGGTATSDAATVEDIQVSVDGGVFSTDGVTCTGCGSADVTWSFTPTSPLADGNHSVAFRAVDSDGAFSTTVGRTLTVDTAAPTFSSVLAVGGDSNVTATFSDAVACASVNAADFSATINGAAVSVASVLCSTTAASSVALSLASAPAAGNEVGVTLSGQVTDQAGNAVLVPTTRTTTATDAESPTIDVLGGPTDGGFTRNQRPAYNGSASSPNRLIDRIEVRVTPSDIGDFGTTGVVCEGCSTASATWTYQPASNLVDGEYTFEFRAVDNSGFSSGTVTRTLTIDNAVPTFSSIMATAGSANVIATFSEPLLCSTVQTTDFTATIDDVELVVEAVTCPDPNDPNSIVLTLAEPFADGAQVEVTLAANVVTDRAGNFCSGGSHSFPDA